MEKAILKSIEGGFNNHKGYTFNRFRWIGGNTKTIVDLVHIHEDGGESSVCTSGEELLLNPLFWKCLGKAEGWEEKMVVRRAAVVGNWAIPGKKVIFDEIDYQMDYIQGWIYHWHRLIDHIAEGGNVDEFFNKLLN